MPHIGFILPVAVLWTRRGPSKNRLHKIGEIENCMCWQAMRTELSCYRGRSPLLARPHARGTPGVHAEEDVIAACDTDDVCDNVTESGVHSSLAKTHTSVV